MVHLKFEPTSCGGFFNPSNVRDSLFSLTCR